MATRIGVNGFGRIGRQVTRAIMESYPQKLEVVAVNDLADARTNAHLFKYDTNYGIYPGTVEARNGTLVIEGKEVRVFSERDPRASPGPSWGWSWWWSPPASSPMLKRRRPTSREGPRRS